eukprot:TRINITY_DN2659_c0_g1_i1.p1 TRINITY_DN2659_c0_g1~~TRINITY_DN2659_c0_g1_i1.p1  ORF type:complete len:214 (+),score=51.41 TRINITY_DN2659_c0_g1_i1:53-694(+)
MKTRTIPVAGAPTNLDDSDIPISRADYQQVVDCFQLIDADHSGKLSWSEAGELGNMLNRRIDVAAFKKLDRDRSGTIDFMELIRCLYPGVPLRELNRAARLWGLPAGNSPKEVAEKGKEKVMRSWRRKYDAKSLEELESIYSLYCGSEPRLTLPALRRAIPRANVADHVIEEVFAAHNTSGTDHLSLEEFAVIMEDSYMQQANRRPEVELYFQ